MNSKPLEPRLRPITWLGKTGQGDIAAARYLVIPGFIGDPLKMYSRFHRMTDHTMSSIRLYFLKRLWHADAEAGATVIKEHGG